MEKSNIVYVKSYFDGDKDNFYSPPTPVKFTSKEKARFNKLALLIDCSGSTNNSYGNIRTRMFSPPTEEKTENVEIKTKIIIFAELEGTAHHVMNVMSRFDLSGVEVSIHSFSDNVFECYRGKIASNDQFYSDIIQKLDAIVMYQYAGTILAPALEKVFDQITPSDKVEFVLTTDGQASDKQEALKYLDGLEKQFNIVVIGAGNIQQSLGTNRGIYKRDPNRPDQRTLVTDGRNVTTVTVTPINTGTNSECDLDYLQKLAQAGKMYGTYFGAFGDYSVLNEASNEYINLSNEPKRDTYKVLLENGYGDLPEKVLDALNEGKCCFDQTPYGDYIFTPKWQVCVEKRSAGLAFIKGEMNHPDFKSSTDYEVMYNMLYNEKRKEVMIGKEGFTLVKTKENLLRVRKIVKFC